MQRRKPRKRTKSANESPKHDSQMVPNEIQHTKCIGRHHNDTKAFDDSQLLLEHLNLDINALRNSNNWRIHSINTWGSLYCNGFQIEYQVKGEIIKGSTHYGNHNNPQQTNFLFEPGEHIIGIEGRSGNIMDTTTIITTQRKIRTGTSNGGTPFGIMLPSGCVAVSLTGGFGGHIHNVGLSYIVIDLNLHNNYNLLSKEDKQTVMTILLCYNRLKTQQKDMNEFGRGITLLPKEVLLLIIGQCVPYPGNVIYTEGKSIKSNPL